MKQLTVPEFDMLWNAVNLARSEQIQNLKLLQERLLQIHPDSEETIKGGNSILG